MYAYAHTDMQACTAPTECKRAHIELAGTREDIAHLARRYRIAGDLTITTTRVSSRDN